MINKIIDVEMDTVVLIPSRGCHKRQLRDTKLATSRAKRITVRYKKHCPVGQAWYK